MLDTWTAQLADSCSSRCTGQHTIHRPHRSCVTAGTVGHNSSVTLHMLHCSSLCCTKLAAFSPSTMHPACNCLPCCCCCCYHSGAAAHRVWRGRECCTAQALLFPSLQQPEAVPAVHGGHQLCKLCTRRRRPGCCCSCNPVPAAVKHWA